MYKKYIIYENKCNFNSELITKDVENLSKMASLCPLISCHAAQIMGYMASCLFDACASAFHMGFPCAA